MFSSLANRAQAAYNDPANRAMASGYLDRGLAAADSLAARGETAYNDNISSERRAQIAQGLQRGQEMAGQARNYVGSQAECMRKCSGSGGKRRRKSKSRKNKRKTRRNKRKTRRY